MGRDGGDGGGGVVVLCVFWEVWNGEWMSVPQVSICISVILEGRMIRDWNVCGARFHVSYDIYGATGKQFSYLLLRDRSLVGWLCNA